jgi:hypothetical protein
MTVIQHAEYRRNEQQRRHGRDRESADHRPAERSVLLAATATATSAKELESRIKC